MIPSTRPDQHGVAPQFGVNVPGTSAGVNSSGMTIGNAVLPGTFAGSVSLTMNAVTVMPAGGGVDGVADEVTVMLNLPS